MANQEKLDIIISAKDNASSQIDSVDNSVDELDKDIRAVPTDTDVNISDGGSIAATDKSAEEAEESLKEMGEAAEQTGEQIKKGANKGDTEVAELKQRLDELIAKRDQMKKEGSWKFGDKETEALGKEIAKVKRELGELGEEAEETGAKTKTSGAEMQLAFQNVSAGIMQAKDAVVEMGRNLMECMEIAGQQEQKETFLRMNIGAEKAAKQIKIIDDLVADLPGDDVAIGGLLSQAAAKNASITADELERMGTNAADYFAAMTNYGKSSTEAQQDLVNYIMAGNTAELERSPVLQQHIDKLKAANTIEERNKALREAMTEEGWTGISQQDTYNNKLETFTASLERGKRHVGELFMNAAGGAMDFIGQLDEATGGVVGMGVAVAAVAGDPMVDLFTGVGQMAMGFNSLKTAFEGTAIATAIAEQGFWSMAVSELAALAPILAIIAALAVVGVAVYEVGKYFGWWSNVSTMLAAVNAGVQRLWAAFINHPDVQTFLSMVNSGWSVMSSAVSKVVSWVISFFNVSNQGDFDLVRAIINAVGTAWYNMTLPIRLVIRAVKAFLTIQETGRKAAKGFITSVVNNIKQLPNKVKTYITNTKNKIKNGAKEWVEAAKKKAEELVDDVIDEIDDLPGKIEKEFSEIPGKIEKALGEAVDAAKRKAAEMPSKVLNMLGIHSPGIIQRAVVGEFEDTLARLKDLNDETDKIGSEFGSGLLTGFHDFSATTPTINATSGGLEMHIVHDYNFSGLPETVTASDVARLINDAAKDDGFTRALAENPRFQMFDSRMKQRINNKRSRSRGTLI